MKKVTTPISAPKHNPSLDKWDGVDLFPEKTAKAREILAKTPWPPRDEKSSSI
ncbi:hypothetical protein [Dyadobacter sp. OTU695]|uniref:hypothetical protein n=1 Tax=Dyadobacter sp. OTU695 TaxID=3043860 RepID=UPI00313B9FB2